MNPCTEFLDVYFASRNEWLKLFGSFGQRGNVYYYLAIILERLAIFLLIELCNYRKFDGST